MFKNLGQAIRYLNNMRVGCPTDWMEQGFETENYWGEDYVTCHWCNDRGDYVGAIQLDERFNLEENYL